MGGKVIVLLERCVVENEQNSQRVVGGNLSGGDQNKKGEDSSVFQKNGLTHFTFNPKTIVTWGFLCGIAGLIVATLSIYQRLNASIDERIQGNRELNRTLDNHEFRTSTLEKEAEAHDKRLTDVEKIVNRGRK